METRGYPEGGNRSKARMEIPDLSGRSDEIGRLSSALRAMVTALYDRIDANERFAKDVAHEIKTLWHLYGLLLALWRLPNRVRSVKNFWTL